MDPDLERVVGDRVVPVGERVAAIGRLAEAVGPDLATRAGLWRDVLLPRLLDETDDEEVRVAAAHAATAVGGVATNTLGSSPSPDRPRIRRAMVDALRAIGRQPLSDHLEGRLHDDLVTLETELTTFPFVNLTLTFGADLRIIPVLHRGTVDPRAEIRRFAVLQLARIGDLAPATRALVEEPDPAVRIGAAEAIGHYWTGEPEPIIALHRAVDDDATQVARAAKSALRRLRLIPIPTPRTVSPPTPLDAEADPRFPWSQLLRRWSHQLCQDRAFALTQDDPVIEAGWTGAGPASTHDLADLESRLGRALPPSYRAFLETTDGYVGGGSVARARPAREVAPFVVEEREWVDAWLEPHGGGTALTVIEHVACRGRDVVDARWSLLSDAVQVSDTFDGAVYLLCPAVVDDAGEWEAWLFATWLPGAARFASWWDLVAEEHRLWQERDVR